MAGELIGDSSHTIDELYNHRDVLFVLLLKHYNDAGWISKYHSDGTKYEGYHLAGIQLSSGIITYHLQDRYAQAAIATGTRLIEYGPEWDGYTPDDVIQRLLEEIDVLSAVSCH